MADIHQHLVAEKMTSTIKLTGTLISAVHEYLWAIDDSVPPELPKLIDALQTVGKALSALRKYSSDDPDLRASVLEKLNALNGPVVECAAELGRLRGKIALGTGEGGWRTMVEKGHVTSYIEQLEKHQQVFALALQVLQDHCKLSKAIGGYIQEMDGGQVELDSPLRQDVQVCKDRPSPVITVEKRKRHLSWLYSADYDSALQSVHARSFPGRGKWILESPIFQNWMKANPGFINLCGSARAGAGKTHITTKIIQHILTLPETTNCAVAYFSFSHMESGQKHPNDILRCLILQLACQARHFVSVSRVLHLRLMSQQLPPTFDKLSRVLIDTARLFKRVFIVLIGLDEYDEYDDHGRELHPFFRALSNQNISLFLICNSQALGGEYAYLAAAKINLSGTTDEIKTYIHWRIEASSNAKYVLGPGANRDKFVADLMEYSHGIFLHVHLVIPFLLQQPTIHHISLELQKLKPNPPTEKEYNTIYSHISPICYTIYTRATARICAQPKNCAALTLKILMWVRKAKETLTIGALREAIAVTDDASGSSDNLDSCDQRTMLDVCDGLITIDEQSGKVRLVHPTAFIGVRFILPVDADYQMAVACLRYLSHSMYSKRATPSCRAPHKSLEDRLRAFPFYEYAAKHLAVHIRACDLALTTELFIKFTESEGHIKSYFQVHGKRSYNGLGKEQLPLRMAIHVRHLPVILRFLDNGINPFTTDQQGQCALHWAVGGNHIDIVRLLVDRWQLLLQEDYDQYKEVLWYHNHEGKSVLHLAARYGFTELVKLFLGYKSTIPITAKGRQTPLHEAVKGGHEYTVQLLLENGVDPLSTDENGQTALHVAAAEGQFGIVTRLIQYRKTRERVPRNPVRYNVSARDNQHITPLHLAALGGHSRILKLLVAAGAKHSAIDKKGETVLHQAVRGGDIESVRLLLGYGADVMAKNYMGITLLHRAATRGHTDVLNILLDRGADISARHGDHTALELALTGGHKEAVQLLFSKGAVAPAPANVDGMLFAAAGDGDVGLVELLLLYGANPSGKPLMNAAEHGHRIVVKLLLDSGADMAIQDISGWTALHHAANEGHLNIVRLLASQSAARNMEDQTALVLAASKGHEQVVRALLPDSHDPVVEDIHLACFLAAQNGHHQTTSLLANRGASMKTTDANGRTAFIIALEEGHSKILEILLRFDVDISERTKKGESALFVAAREGHLHVVRMLLEKGADVTETNGEGQTALFGAGKYGHRDIYSLLVEKGVNQFVRDQSHNMASIADEAGEVDDDGDDY